MPMKEQTMAQRIVILDGYTLNPGDLSWDAISALGKIDLYDRTPANKVADRIGDARIVLTNKAVIDARTIEQCTDLAYIGVTATGTNIVDLQAAKDCDVVVTNAPGYSSSSVSQSVFALLLEMTNHTATHARMVREGAWTACEDFSFTAAPIVELAGKTLGIVGVGAIGSQVAKIGAALGMNIAAAHQRSASRVKLPGIDVAWMSMDELFTAADVVTLHCPLTDETKELVNADRIRRMKSSAYLINTGRGPLIDEAALAEALRVGRIAGAGLDVLSSEPPKPGNPLLGVPRCVITPHVAWASTESRQRLLRIVADNIAAFLRDEPRNVVNA